MKDVTSMSYRMERNSCLLYPSKSESGSDPCSHQGMVRLEDGTGYWIKLWPRLVKDKQVFELRFTRRQEDR
jgi:hypothetical protein